MILEFALDLVFVAAEALDLDDVSEACSSDFGPEELCVQMQQYLC